MMSIKVKMISTNCDSILSPISVCLKGGIVSKMYNVYNKFTRTCIFYITCILLIPNSLFPLYCTSIF